MAVRSYAATLKYEPYTTDWFLQPLIAEVLALRSLEDALNDLLTKTNIWEGMADKDNDTYTYAKYSAYKKALEDLVDKLASQGAYKGSRRDLLDLKARYATEMTPIELAYTKRAEDIKRLLSISDRTGGTTLFTRDAATTSLDDYLNGVEDFGQVNTEDILKTASTLAKGYSERYMSAGPGRDVYNSTYHTWTTKKGFSPQEVTAMWLNEESDLNALRSNLLLLFGMTRYRPEDLLVIDNAIIRGINLGLVYDTDTRLILAKDRILSEEGSTPLTSSSSNIDRAYWFETIQLDKMRKGLTDNLGHLNVSDDLFDDDGKLVPLRGTTITVSLRGIKGDIELPTNKSNLYDKLKSFLLDLGYTEEQIGDLTKEEIRSIVEKPDIRGQKMYKMSLDPTNTEKLLEFANAAGDAQEVEKLDEDLNPVLKTGSQFIINNFKNKASLVLLNPINGDIYLYDGEKYYKLPEGIFNSDAVEAMRADIAYKLKIDDLYNEAIKSKEDLDSEGLQALYNLELNSVAADLSIWNAFTGLLTDYRYTLAK